MKRVFILKGLDCPNCSAKIEKEVGALPGVESSVVNSRGQVSSDRAYAPNTQLRLRAPWSR